MAGDGLFQDIGNWFYDITGGNARDQSKAASKAGTEGVATGQTTMEGAAGLASDQAYAAQALQKKNASQYAKEAGLAGQALGEQLGRTAATQGTQAATQAARTQGINKGQAALLGSQQAGNAYTQGQLQGQQLGMGAYGQGANTQLGAINAGTAAAATQGSIGSSQAQAGLGQLGAGLGQGQLGQQQNQDLFGGISKLAGGIAGGGGGGGMAEGGIVMSPVTATIGEAGPEAVIPLNDMDKVKAILKTVYSTTKKKKEKVNA